MPGQAARVADSLRYALKLNPMLGAGNYLHHAHAINRARDEPLVYSDQPFVVPGGNTRNEPLSISGLKKLSDSYAAWYIGSGIVPMDPVAVYVEDGVQDLVQYSALTSIGAIPVLVNGAMEHATAARFFRHVGAVAVMTDRARYDRIAPLIESDALKFVTAIEEVAEPEAELPIWFPFEHRDDDPVMITHSSGTTDKPKAVMLQHGGWFHGIRELLGLEAPQGAERYLSSLPASHNAAIAYSIHAILNGSAILIMSDRRGEAVARAIEQFRPATVVSFPQTYVELAQLDPREHDFSSVTLWINSGDAAHEVHIRRLVAYGYHERGGERIEGSQFVDGLGSSEMGHSSFRIIHTPYTNAYQRCVGFPQKWVEAAVLDAEGAPVPVGVVGRLGVRSPSATFLYWNDSVLTYRSRRAGYCLTGDLVYRDTMGCFYHVDRVPDVIITAEGPLYSLQTEETILAHRDDLRDCTVVGIAAPDGETKPVLLAVPRNGSGPAPAELLEDINARQAANGRPAIAEARIVHPDEIPIGVTGKVLKRTLRETLQTARLSGDVPAVPAGRRHVPR